MKQKFELGASISNDIGEPVRATAILLGVIGLRVIAHASFEMRAFDKVSEKILAVRVRDS
jgi:hypothetical protein